ncbi:MAG: hypothetical protein U9R66_03950 [Thermodesulfobacteriota bacterium]|nr:hypothetical protein [Thermodesulfobacteriota bacterium]
MIQKLHHLVIDFEAVQKEQADCLSANRLKTLMSWCGRREKVFMQLRQGFEQLGEGGSQGADDRKQLQDILLRLLKGEKKLESLSSRQREVVKKKVYSIRKGRKAVKGYSMYHGETPKPKYLSSRTF